MTEAPGCLWFAWRRISQNFAESYKFGKGLTGTNFVTINPFDLLNETQACINNACVTIEPARCPQFSHFVKCGSTCHEHCGEPKPMICNKMCFRGCVCDDGYVLDSNEQCIRREDCPPQNSSADFNNTCVGVDCRPGYECVDGRCVLRRDCPLVSMVPPSSNCMYVPETDSRGCLRPRLMCSTAEPKPANDIQQPQQCGPNAHMSNCTNFCPVIHCGNLYRKIVCFSLRCGPPGCVCNDGYVFKSLDKSRGCVKRDECTDDESGEVLIALTSGSKVCGPNERHTNCGSACEPVCPPDEPKPCVAMCIADVCECKPGFLRHKTKGCVRQEEC
ncbi:unnamed protein product [Enterobius vermicularis]|uniref:TIL domain-containing protein n=1 Tax=Enterobius vermicularis TaxID=51028 RepID=A0A0N4V8Z3_ENTVE|nr:unnamed protein product [Enterobius vermicularis]